MSVLHHVTSISLRCRLHSDCNRAGRHIRRCLCCNRRSHSFRQVNSLSTLLVLWLCNTRTSEMERDRAETVVKNQEKLRKFETLEIFNVYPYFMYCVAKRRPPFYFFE